MCIEKGSLNIIIEGNNEGQKNNEPLKPSNFDLSELTQLFIHIENFLKPLNKNNSLITYELKEGSAKNLFIMENDLLKSSNDIFYQIQETKSLRGLQPKQAESIYYFQNMSRIKNRFITISNSLEPNIFIQITPYTNYVIEEEIYIDTELPIYGIVTYIGGKKDSSIHIDTNEYGVITVKANQYILKQIKTNIIYKEIGMIIHAKQNIDTYKIKDATFVEWIEYSTTYDKDYMDKLIEIGTEAWKDVTDVNQWLKDIRS